MNPVRNYNIRSNLKHDDLITSKSEISNGMKGFTLLFSLLFISIALAIGIGVATLIIGEVGLTGSGRESQIAFYAADSGAECALYWDRVKDQFSFPGTEFTCSGQTGTVAPAGSLSRFSLTFENGSCVDVTVNKSDPAETVITALGHNICPPEGGLRVERGLEVRY